MSRPRPRWIPAAVILVAALATGSTARSAYMLEFDQANYTAVANGTVTVSVFLRETVTTNLATQGLIAADFRLLFNESPRVAQPAQVIARILNPAFDSPASLQPAILAATALNSGRADVIQSSFDPVTQTAATPGRVLLGQFTFQVGATAGVVTQLVAIDNDATADGLVLANDVAIDALTAAGRATITVTAVPEPASIVLLASAMPVAWLIAARRRRH